MDVVAIVVTYNPPAGFLAHLDVWMSQVDGLLIVDNGTEPYHLREICGAIQNRFTNVEFIFNSENLGIGAALNSAFARLIKSDLEAAFVFDQDSQPMPGMVAESLRVYHQPASRNKIALVAPTVEVPAAKTAYSFLVPRGRVLFERVHCTNEETLENVSVVISSGALYDLRAYQDIGPFREDFFIDYVDTEYCLRARQHGYTIEVACHARLSHQMGDQRQQRAGPLTMHPTFHSPVRWYYMSRNRIPMMGRYALRYPYWLLYELVLNLNGLVRLILFEDQKLAKLRAIAFGTLDGLMNRMGPISLRRRSLIVSGENGG